MSSPRLDEPLYVFDLSKERDGVGSLVLIWSGGTDYIWHEKQRGQGRQVEASEQSRSERTETFSIRHDPRFVLENVRDKIGLFDGSFYYRIVSVFPDRKYSRNTYLILTVEYVQNRPITKAMP